MDWRSREEAFGVPLGLLVKKGRGIDCDFLHLHYRATPTLVGVGLPMEEAMRLIMNKATDRHTGGRNFAGHYCDPKWNVAPVTSVIGTQYSTALGTAHAQSRPGESSSAITIVTGGMPARRKGILPQPWCGPPGRSDPCPCFLLCKTTVGASPLLIRVSTGRRILWTAERLFNMETALINGNDPVESYMVLKDKIQYVREKRRPVLLEAFVSRLYGHSSASGANYVKGEPCCIALFEDRLKKAGLLSEKEQKNTWESLKESALKTQQEIKKEQDPRPESIWDLCIRKQ